MWTDDPWAREQHNHERERQRVSLANRLDDVVRRASDLSVASGMEGWEGRASVHAQAEIDELVQRLHALRARVWSAVA